MRGLIERGARAALAAILVGAALIWAETCAGASRPASVTAGAASVEMPVPAGTPLAGYGSFPRRAWIPDILGRYPYAFWFQPSAGSHDPLKVRSLVLESANLRVLWLSLDLVGIDPTLVTALRQRLSRDGLRYDAVIASASHTHSGPGAYADSALFGFIAADRMVDAVRRSILDTLERAAREAEARKAAATLAAGHAEVRDITESRVQEGLDPELGLLKVLAAGGRPVAAVWNYAIHGTALPRDNFLLSGDLMAEASARIEREIGAPALFVNGAVGDVSPRARGWAGVKSAGAALASGAIRAWTEAQSEPARLEIAGDRATLPGATVTIRNCLGGWAPAWMTLGLADILPSSPEVVALAIGRTAWVTIPGELETRLGMDIKAAGRDRFSHVFIAGVSNDYLGYFLTPEHYRRPSYIACGSLYGERGGEIMRDTALSALHKLGESTAEARPAPAPRRAIRRGR